MNSLLVISISILENLRFYLIYQFKFLTISFSALAEAVYS